MNDCNTGIVILRINLNRFKGQGKLSKWGILIMGIFIRLIPFTKVTKTGI
jgi:hypothetical protein